MEIPTTNNEYENAKREAYLFYKSIGRTWCPALNDYVAFNKIGFGHLIRKGRVPRAQSEQMRRFALLPCAENIIRSKLISSVEEKTVRESSARYWKFIEYNNGTTIKLIVRQIQGGHKHFLSIYGKTKNPRRSA